MEVIKEIFLVEIGYNVWNVLYIEDLLVINYFLLKSFLLKNNWYFEVIILIWLFYYMYMYILWL